MKNNVSLLLFKNTVYLYEGVDVVHQSLGSANDELVDAGDGMGPAGRQQHVNSRVNTRGGLMLNKITMHFGN